MSLKVTPVPSIPAEMKQLVKGLLAPTDTFVVIGDQLADFLSDADFADLYHAEGKPAYSPARLALVTIFQYMENLSDRQAAAMVYKRLDWRYALHLGLSGGGFDYSVLCEFRARLVAHQAQARVFEQLLKRLGELGLVKGRGVQRTDALAVLGAVSRLTRLELVYETLRVALMAIHDEDVRWLHRAVPDSLIARYGERAEEERLVREHGDKGQAEAKRLAAEAGRDGRWLLQRIAQPDTPQPVQDVPAVQTLRRVWEQQFDTAPAADGSDSSSAAPLPLRLRETLAVPGAELINTPQDPEARYSHKRGNEWLGYKVHVTETVAADAPRVLTDVRTTPATEADAPQVAPIQADLAARGLSPRQQAVDMNYVSGQTLADSAARHIQLLGPARPDTSWQAQHGGFTRADFELNAQTQTARCPQGHRASAWQGGHTHGRPTVQIAFDAATCGACPLNARCIQPGATGPRGRTLTVSAHHALIDQRRAYQRTAEFKRQYRRRAGIEATFSLLVRQHGLRQARYRGLQKTRLQHYGIGTACNLKRCARWLAGDRPTTRTRRPKSMKLRPASRRTVVASG